MHIELSIETADKMKFHAEKIFPNEACGFFYGEDIDQTRKIVDALSITNSQQGDQRRRFEISSKDYLNAELYADHHRLKLLGIYHSHPNHPAIPSEYDRVKALPFFSYIIISVLNNESKEMKSWILNEEQKFIEEIITIKN
ncbi:MAG: M67 family metallopeptidase [Bacteroidota bacterium]|nr:M67 family metallopeptidase [Bacteroidota bacterium]